MADNRIKNVKVITPVGVFVYPRFGTPDTKFKKEGQYSTRLRLSAEEAAPMIEQISKLQAEMFEHTKAQLEAQLQSTDKKVMVKAKQALSALKLADDKPYKNALDEDGEETGEIEFNFKMIASYTDKKTGVLKRMKPDVVDGKGKKMDGDKVWGGSEGKIGGFLKPFYTPKVGVGVSLGLGAVQVTKLVGKGSSFAFGEVEGGYQDESDDTPSQTSQTDSSSADSTDEEENSEF